MEYEGTSYAQVVVKIGQNMWDNLDGWSRFLVTIAPAITPVLIIAAVALIVGLLLGTAEKARGLHISTGAYLAGKFAPRKIFKFISNNTVSYTHLWRWSNRITGALTPTMARISR